MKYNTFTFQDDKLLCWRLGPMNAQKQKHYHNDIPSLAGAGTHKPPVSRGIWAFPYPHYDLFFCWHQWEKHLPKKYQRISEMDLTEKEWEDREELLKKIRKIFRPSIFYTDNFYSHIFPNGKTDYSDWYFWENPRDWAKIAQGKLFTFYRYDDDKLTKIGFSKDHLEIFVP